MDVIVNTLNLIFAFFQKNLLMILSNTALAVSIICSFALITKLWHEKKVREEIFNINQSPKKKQKVGLQENNFFKKGFFGTLYKNLEIYLSTKERKQSVDMVHYSVIGVATFIGIAMFSTGQKLVGVILPFGLCYLVSFVLSLIRVNRIDKIREQLPAAINNLTRVMTKYSSLKTILYETASTVEDPMGGILKQLSLKMSSESGTDVLNEFMDEYNDIWIYSFAFTLQSYLEDSEKAAVVANLKELRDIIEKEIEQKKAEALEKKMTVSINYVLVVLAVIMEIANIIFNPGASSFFFKSMAGFVAFMIGNGLLVACVISNILLTKK